MTKVAILSVLTATGDIAYHAIAGDKQSHGKTAGEALDALTAQLPEDEAGTLVIVQTLRPDRFFDANQQQRLAELMTRWRATRDVGATLPTAEQAELDALIEEEIRAAAKRTAALLHELTR
ncbi:MAG: hypothetical protein HY731_06050 [Candidatus Tectomicrobia bacterium]|nr:hypothetical protein [Candidatus Tectomicrobia bacterium]